MSDLPSPSAARLPKARWMDPRLVIGVLLVLVSVVVGSRVVAQADDSIQVWGAATTLGPGDTVDASELVPVKVRMTDASAYLTASGQPPVGYQVTREVGKGELLPKEALAKPGTLSVRRVVIEVPAGTVDGLTRGRLVDVYAVPEADTAKDQEAAQPRLVLSRVTVDRVADGGGGFGANGSTVGVALLVDEKSVPDLLSAVAAGSVHLAQLPTGAERRSASGS